MRVQCHNPTSASFLFAEIFHHKHSSALESLNVQNFVIPYCVLSLHIAEFMEHINFYEILSYHKYQKTAIAITDKYDVQNLQ